MKKYLTPKHNELDGQVIEYGGQHFKLSQTAAITMPIMIPQPKITIAPSMRFDTDDEGALVMRIKLNPKPDYTK